MTVRIEYDDRDVQDALNRLQARVDDLDPVMREIAGHLKDSVDEAFASQATPDGSAWKPLAESTIVDRLRRGYRAGPILERSGDLAGRLLAVWDAESAVVGSGQTFGGNVLAAAVHHFGTRDGRVPARPFFAVSDEARSAIIDSLLDHLGEPLER
ncbi:MAG: phage virion morphogenesis protein [Gammaproteobacteria bacterium]|nr:phage virion morphogenesis protein [Gammaproteobacteria bacterium]